MISEPENIYILDERATRRAQRLVAALNNLEAQGKTDTKRYRAMLQELNSLTVKNKRRAGARVIVPRI